jgi:PhzF family phenazine biosynthesis protein
MTQSVRVFQVDAFTRQPFTGNPAGVVLDADDLSAEQMQLIARELNNGDTAFLLRADAADHDLRVRFFTPRAEAGFVGHATVAAHAVLAAIGHAPAPRQRQKTGLVTVSVQRDAAGTSVSIAQPTPRIQQPPGAAAMIEVLEALGLQQAALDPRVPATIAGETSTRLLIGVRDGGVLARLTPDLPRLAALSATAGAPGYFVYTLQPAVSDCDTEARMFCPALGINEDPVSGNAHGMLGAYLLQRGLLPPPAMNPDQRGFTGAQGHHVGRPGSVRIDLAVTGGELRGATITGNAVIVFETRISL